MNKEIIVLGTALGAIAIYYYYNGAVYPTPAVKPDIKIGVQTSYPEPAKEPEIGQTILPIVKTENISTTEKTSAPIVTKENYEVTVYPVNTKVLFYSEPSVPPKKIGDLVRDGML